MPASYRALDKTEITRRIHAIKQTLGDQLFMPCHHYQQDEIVALADATGDSLELARLSAANQHARHIVFCGVHFMAETADILSTPAQKVYLPDARAGCSMADMAEMQQVESAWEALQQTFGDTLIPLTYVNSSAEIKAFVGRHGGACVTSGNAEEMVQWALQQKQRLLFLPDRHLGRNTAFALGVPLEQMAEWNPHQHSLSPHSVPTEQLKVILWQGHCAVHERFTPENIHAVRAQHPEMKIIVHPECSREVVALSDEYGSTRRIIEQIAAAPAGSAWAVGTEMNLVKRLQQQHPEQKIISLNPEWCTCPTMNLIDLPHLLWTLESVVAGESTHQIRVPDAIATDAQAALAKMLKRF